MTQEATEKHRYNELYRSLLEHGKLMNVRGLIGRAARLWPDKAIVICNEKQITYEELYLRALQLAHTLRERGVKKGERVIIFYENSIEFYVAYFAVWLAGGIVAPLNVFLHEHEFIKIVHEAVPRIIIVSPTLKEKLHLQDVDYPNMISGIDIDSPRGQLRTRAELQLEDTEHHEDNELAALLYTSGTTGFPKGVMLSSHNIIINAIQGIARFEVKEDERVFCALPLFHSLPQNICMWAATIVGATAIIVEKIERRALLKGIAHKPTIIVAVPALYGLFCMLKTVRFGKVKYFISGGDALSDKIRSLFEIMYTRKLCNGYGLTEAAPFIAIDVDDYTQPTNTIGKPFIGIEWALRNDAGTSVRPGSIGTLWIKGDNIMMGYYKAPDATHAIVKNGWLNTGDLAYATAEGKIVLAGRERDLISNKGLKIYPQEVENILLSHAAVLQAGVIGVKDADHDEIPVAFIASKEKNTDALITELRNLCMRSLAPYKVPRRFYIRKELVITTTGKVDKKILRAELESGT